MEVKVVCPHCGGEDPVEVVIDAAKIVAALRKYKKRHGDTGLGL